jgi:hypothetical protein
MITQSLFITALNENQLLPPYNAPKLYWFYSDYINNPISEAQDEDGDKLNRGDFYEAISMMSWALYRGWAKKVVDENYPLECFDVISKEYVIELFWDNLNCTEGISLLEKISDVTGIFTLSVSWLTDSNIRNGNPVPKGSGPSHLEPN